MSADNGSTAAPIRGWSDQRRTRHSGVAVAYKREDVRLGPAPRIRTQLNAWGDRPVGNAPEEPALDIPNIKAVCWAARMGVI